MHRQTYEERRISEMRTPGEFILFRFHEKTSVLYLFTEIMNFAFYITQTIVGFS